MCLLVCTNGDNTFQSLRLSPLQLIISLQMNSLFRFLIRVLVALQLSQLNEIIKNAWVGFH
jgi:hypothetical protein